MLKVIAQDFIKPECIELVMPYYSELVEKTPQDPTKLMIGIAVTKFYSPWLFANSLHC